MTRLIHKAWLASAVLAPLLQAAEVQVKPAVAVEYTSVANQFQQLQSSSDLSRWLPVGSWVVSQSNRVQHYFQAEESAQFYRTEQAPVRDLTSILEGIRATQNLPALGCAVIRSNRIVGFGVTGVRKSGASPKVTPQDLWHHGSLTKSMTATLAAIMVQEGKIQWSTRLVDVFPDKAAAMKPGWELATLELLLANRAGAMGDLGPSGIWSQLWNHAGTPTEQRLLLLDRLTALAPKTTPGTAYEYSNAGFALAGAMLEKVAGIPWEDLITQKLFLPLGMTSAGFGVPASPRYIDQPWGHTGSGTTRTPMAPGTDADNPPGIGPAGTVHCNLSDFARYVAFHLAGSRGQAELISPEAFTKLHTALENNSNYALGWNIGERPWAQGKTISHTGSNLQWYTNVWIAPNRDWACVVVTNFGGTGAFAATDSVVGRMIQEFL